MSKEIKTNYNFTRGLGLYLPKQHSRKWELENKIEDMREVTLKMPLAMLRALFEVIGVLTAEDMGSLLGRYVGMNKTIANDMNAQVNGFVAMVHSQGMKPRLKPDMEPKSWATSREKGWADVK